MATKLSELFSGMKTEQLNAKHKIIYFMLNKYKPFAVLNATPPQALSKLIEWGGEDIEVKRILFTKDNGYVDMDEVK
jgi:hypothetical protein